MSAYTRAVATLKPASLVARTAPVLKPSRHAIYAVLLSSASREVYPDYVGTVRYPTPALAFAGGLAITRAQPGILFTVMVQEPGAPWRDRKTGASIAEALECDWMHAHGSRA